METDAGLNPAVAVARRIVEVIQSCQNEAQLETARRYVILACRKYRMDFLPLMGTK